MGSPCCGPVARDTGEEGTVCGEVVYKKSCGLLRPVTLKQMHVPIMRSVQVLNKFLLKCVPSRWCSH